MKKVPLMETNDAHERTTDGNMKGYASQDTQKHDKQHGILLER